MYHFTWFPYWLTCLLDPAFHMPPSADLSSRSHRTGCSEHCGDSLQQCCIQQRAMQWQGRSWLSGLPEWTPKVLYQDHKVQSHLTCVLLHRFTGVYYPYNEQTMVHGRPQTDNVSSVCTQHVCVRKSYRKEYMQCLTLPMYVFTFTCICTCYLT